MRILPTYKSIIIAFIVIFSIFNFGLPVVLHYCKMMHSFSAEQCSMCHKNDTDSTQKNITKSIEHCCSNFIVVKANENHFIKNHLRENIFSLNFVKHHIENDQRLNFTKLINLLTFSQPNTYIDIPILNSTLLI